MKFSLRHNNFNVLDLDKSIAFYESALGMKVERLIERETFKLAFLSDGHTAHEIELTWQRDRVEPYALGDNETHTCFAVDDYDKAHEKHQGMGCICFENVDMGLYFIEDPDGYWIEIVPEKR